LQAGQEAAARIAAWPGRVRCLKKSPFRSIFDGKIFHY